MVSRCEHSDRITTNLRVASDRQDATVVTRTSNDIPTAVREVAADETSGVSDTPRPLSDVERVASDAPCDGPDVQPDTTDPARHQDIASAMTGPPVIADRGIVSVDRDPVSAGPADTDGPVYRPTDGNIPPRAVPPVGDGCGHPELVAPDADSVTARIRPRDQTVDSGGPGAVPRPDADGTTVSGRDGPAPPRPVRGRRSRVVVEPPAFVALDAERWRTAVAVLSRLFARLLADPAFLDGVSRSGSVPEDPPSSVQMPPNPV